MTFYNLTSYYNDAFGIDHADAVDISMAVAQLDTDERLAPECSEYFDGYTRGHVAANRPLNIH